VSVSPPIVFSSERVVVVPVEVVPVPVGFFTV